MEKKLTNNLGLKILALLFSFILWLIVVNINDPIKTVSYSGIKVEIINESALTEQGKVYEILDNTGTVTVSVTANRSTFDNITQENIRAVADMKEISFMDTVRINAYSTKNSDKIESVKSNTENLKLHIEDVKNIQLVITPIATGKPADGYVLGDISTNQNIVRISGPESVVSSIAKATVSIDIAGMTSSINTNAELKLYDTEDKLIENASIKKNIDDIGVSAQILATKEVPISCVPGGDVARGYLLTEELLIDPATVTLAGSKKTLDAVKLIEIPETAFDVTGQTVDVTQIIDIRKYLPENTVLANGDFNGKVSVTATISKAEVASMEIPMEHFSIINVPQGFKASIEQEGSISVEVEGLSETMETIGVQNIKGTLDMGLYMEKQQLTELTEGIYPLQVTFEVPEGAEVISEIKLNVIIEALE